MIGLICVFEIYSVSVPIVWRYAQDCKDEEQQKTKILGSYTERSIVIQVETTLYHIDNIRHVVDSMPPQPVQAVLAGEGGHTQQ